MKKKIMSTELCYLIGVVVIMTGTGMIAMSGLGVSPASAPCYILYLKLSEYYPWFTYGVGLYTFEAMLLVLMCLILRSFRISYLFSFFTSFLAGNILDLVNLGIYRLPQGGWLLQTVYFLIGELICALGIAFMYRTYVAQEVFDLFVTEVARAFRQKDYRVKMIYDGCSVVLGLILMISCFGLWPFRGIGIGTLACAGLNGVLIKWYSKYLDRWFDFRDCLPLRKYFQ